MSRIGYQSSEGTRLAVGDMISNKMFITHLAMLRVANSGGVITLSRVRSAQAEGECIT
jgi:hypothetical protein